MVGLPLPPARNNVCLQAPVTTSSLKGIYIYTNTYITLSKIVLASKQNQFKLKYAGHPS